MSRSADLIDWGVASRVARVVGGRGPDTTPDLRRSVRADLAEFSARSDELVRAFTGLEPQADPLDPVVLDRGGWADANMASLRHLIAPLTEKLSRSVAGMGIGRRVAGAGLGLQLGVLLGYLSSKVLGQYDLVLATDAVGRVYYVGPNIVEAERRGGLEPRDFRLWIALHEITHRTQFASVPWLRARVRAMMEQSMASLEIDAARVKQIIERGKELLRGGPEAWRRATVMDVFMSEPQRELVAEMQALMTIVEGHGTFVMNRIGAERIPSFEQMRRAMDARRGGVAGPERAFQRVIGMDMKYEQYTAGERFMDAVADLADERAVNAVWDRPENIPTADELTHPAAWLERVRG